jgi:hypothetical protein
MPALAIDLGGLGLPMELAGRVGFTVVNSITGVGTTQVGAAAIPAGVNNVSTVTAGGTTAFILPAAAELEVPYFVTNPSATTALIFPPTGGAINAAGANASVSIVTLLARVFIRKSTNVWISFLAA